MKVVLVSPNSDNPLIVRHKVRNAKFHPPLGLLYLASVIKNEFETVLVDSQVYDLTPEQIAENILAFCPDVVGLSVNYTLLSRNAKRIAKCLKETDPSIKIVFGGNFATFFADELMKESFIDIVVLKEGEISFKSCLQRLAKGKSVRDIPGIVFRENGSVQRNAFTSYIKNLDSLPFPDFTLLEEPKKYSTNIITSRGCIFNCVYCSTQSMWQNWRPRTPSNIIAEIKEKSEKFNFKYFRFTDDNFCCNKERVRELIGLINNEGIEGQWSFFARNEMIDGEMLELCGKAKCKKIFFGIESGSERILKRLRRAYSIFEVEQKINKALECGILPLVSFMIGMPWETEDDIKQTFDLMQRINTPALAVHVFTPYPGTEIHNHPEKYGVLIETHNPEEIDMTGGTVFHSTDYLSSEDIRKMWIEGVSIAMSRQKELKEYMRQLES